MASGHVDERIPEETDSMMTTHEYTMYVWNISLICTNDVREVFFCCSTNGFVLPNQREPLSQILSRNFKMLLPFRKIEKYVSLIENYKKKSNLIKKGFQDVISITIFS